MIYYFKPYWDIATCSISGCTNTKSKTVRQKLDDNECEVCEVCEKHFIEMTETGSKSWKEW